MLAIIIVSFGRLELMKKTLNSLKDNGLDKSKMSLTVIDNGSQQPLINYLIQEKSIIDNLILLNKNMGKPYAWNLGVKISNEECKINNTVQPDYYLFCDNDLDFKPGWYNKLLSAYEEHKDLPLCALSGLRWPSHELTGLQKGNTQINVIRFPPGCCLLMSRKAFEANGKWDTKRLIRTVDTSYLRNAHRRGFKNASIHPETVIDHTGRRQRTWNISNGKPKLLP